MSGKTVYTYVGNDPADKFDPTGTSCETATGDDGQVQATSCKIDQDRDKLVAKYGEDAVANIETGYKNAVNNLLAQGTKIEHITVDVVDSKGNRTGETVSAKVTAAAIANTLIARNVGYDPTSSLALGTSAVQPNFSFVGSGITSLLDSKSFFNTQTWFLKMDREMMKAWVHEGMHTPEVHSQLGPREIWEKYHTLPFQQTAERLLTE